jgi:hypothetical protein
MQKAFIFVAAAAAVLIAGAAFALVSTPGADEERVDELTARPTTAATTTRGGKGGDGEGGE